MDNSFRYGTTIHRVVYSLKFGCVTINADLSTGSTGLITIITGSFKTSSYDPNTLSARKELSSK